MLKLHLLELHFSICQVFHQVLHYPDFFEFNICSGLIKHSWCKFLLVLISGGRMWRNILTILILIPIHQCLLVSLWFWHPSSVCSLLVQFWDWAVSYPDVPCFPTFPPPLPHSCVSNTCCSSSVGYPMVLVFVSWARQTVMWGWSYPACGYFLTFAHVGMGYFPITS